MKKILLVEDEELIQKSLQKLLEAKGADVDVCSLGKSAIVKIHEVKYDKIITDLMLGDISGFDILEESKKIYQLEDIGEKFVIITAYSSAQVIEKAQKYNCQIISKPFENLAMALEIFLQ